jgi:hypothetical protein
MSAVLVALLLLLLFFLLSLIPKPAGVGMNPKLCDGARIKFVMGMGGDSASIPAAK